MASKEVDNFPMPNITTISTDIDDAEDLRIAAKLLDLNSEVEYEY